MTTIFLIIGISVFLVCRRPSTTTAQKYDPLDGMTDATTVYDESPSSNNRSNKFEIEDGTDTPPKSKNRHFFYFYSLNFMKLDFSDINKALLFLYF